MEKYSVKKMIGGGAYGKVYAARNNKTQQMHALKVVPMEGSSKVSITEEVKIAYTLVMNGGVTHNCLAFYESFVCNGKAFVAYELCAENLHQFQSSVGDVDFPYPVIRCITRQILEATMFMHSMGIIHMDLKPENIMLLNAASDPLERTNFSVRIGDYGGGKFIQYIDAANETYITTQPYKAPEMILNKQASKAYDLWSIGCILFELFDGRQLFDTRSVRKQLALMECVLGEFPIEILKTWSKSPEYFDVNGKVDLTKHPNIKQHLVSTQRQPLEKYVVSDEPESFVLLALVKKLLQIDLLERPTAKLALEHQFFKMPMEC